MNDQHRLTVRLLKMCDLLLVAVSFLLTTIYRVRAERSISLARFLSMRTKISNLLILIFALVVCHLIFTLCGLYDSRRLTGRSREFRDVARATTIFNTFFLALSYVFSIRMVTMQFLAIFWGMTTLMLAASRFALRRIADRVRVHGRDLRYMLILGANPRALEFARHILAKRKLGYRLLGFVDDDWPGAAAVKGAGYEVVSNIAGLAEYLRGNVVDEVAFYLPFGSFYQYSAQAAELCQQHGITMRVHSNFFGLKTAKWRPEEFDGEQYIATYTYSKELWPRTAKRLFDIGVAGGALVCLAPVMILAAIAIKLTSPGPIFFVQERIGLNKRRFKIFKFRTMTPGAEKMRASLEAMNEAGGPNFKMRNDPRVTPVGRILRRSSIDETPQLLNVLVGDMSLVGPRPLPVRDYEGFNQDWQRRRFSVKPGITCLWQVGGRSQLTFEQWMKLDLLYMDEWSMWLDLKILTRTLPAVLRGVGAV